MRDLDVVSGPEYHAGSRRGVVTVEAALTVHTLKGVLLLTGEARMPWGRGVRRSNVESNAGSGISFGIRGSMGDRVRTP